MKRLFILGGLVVVGCCLSACRKNSDDTLNLLNWGEYIDPELIDQFEDEYNVTVEMKEVTSSEEMYTDINEGASYDVAIPGDYVIEQMISENLIKKFDMSKIENYSSSSIFNDKLVSIVNNTYSETNINLFDYSAPYFWGTYAVIYNTQKTYIKDVVEANGFNALFDRSLYGSNASDLNLSMYDVARWGLSAWLITQGKDINTTNVGDFAGADDVLAAANYKVWGDDNIKKQIQSGNLDVGLVQLGDFFDEYYVVAEENKTLNVGCYIPSNNAAFYDGMVIPNNCSNEDLAYKFINFMLDPEIAFANAQYVGYCPTLKSVATSFRNDSSYADQLSSYPFYLDPFYNVTDISGIKQFRFNTKMSDNTNYLTYLSNVYLSAKNKSKK